MATGWNVSRNMKNEVTLSDVALANVEALAEEINSECPNGCLAQCGSGCQLAGQTDTSF
ncbi:MAG: NVEALA domain-containing protein [Tannerella sp.]|nr:NVEALA domain-containing protein [Tannerella sp.]